MKKIYSLLTIALASLSAFAQTTLPPIIDSSIVLTKTNSPYEFTQNTLVTSNGKITVEPGVSVFSKTPINLIIQGTVVAEGTVTDSIRFEGFTFKTDSKTISTNFQYCVFQGSTTAGTYIIYNDGASLKFANCRFVNGYYSIYSRGGTVNTYLTIDNCSFVGKSGRGYPIYSSGSYTTLNISNSQFYGMYSLYVYGKVVNVERSEFVGIGSVNMTIYKTGNIICNKFKNIESGITLNNYSSYDTITIKFNKNLLDSVGHNYPMLKIYGTTPQVKYPVKIDIHNNNFLYSYATVKLLIQGTNSTPTTYTEINATENYWNTTDSSKISDYINDYSDNILIWGKVNTNNFLLKPATTCFEVLGVFEPTLPSKEVVMVLDLLGKEVSEVKSNTVYIYIYSDGSKQKQIIIE